ncbi:MAG: PP2C family serine/threonine-protein phosphatase [Sulfurovum sp.]|nr:PP2C family serine/threonine-protein phosphatase [Sulfurovum sp.]
MVGVVILWLGEGAQIAVDKSTSALEKVLSSELGKDLEEIFFNYHENKTDELKNILDSKLKETILSAAYTGLKGIADEAEETHNDIKDYSTTLLMAAHKKTKYGHLVVTFWVGDGVIALYTKEKDVLLLGEPDSGEFAGQTRFLDASFFYDTSRIKIELVQDFTALILATDGVSDPYFETDESLGSVEKWDDFWAKISSFVTQKDSASARKDLLRWLDFWSKGNHDDRTIALLLPSENALPEDENIDLIEVKEDDNG